MNIPQVDDTFPIQTAWHNRAIHKNGRLAAKRMTEAFSFILRRCQARPLELVILVQIDVIRHPHAPAGFNPLLDSVVQIKFLLQYFERLAISALVQIGCIVLRQVP